jgi:hypothetical protein
MRQQAIKCLLLLLVLPSCEKESSAPVPPTNATTTIAPTPKKRIEVLSNPDLIYDGTVPLSEMEFHGVKLGDSESKISRDEMPVDAEGWTKGIDISYKIFNGRVIEIKVFGGLLREVPIRDLQEMEMRFGKADRVVKSEYFPAVPDVDYLFYKRHVKVTWLEGRSGSLLTGITFFK